MQEFCAQIHRFHASQTRNWALPARNRIEKEHVDETQFRTEDNAKEDGGDGNLHRGVYDERSSADSDRKRHDKYGPGFHRSLYGW